MSSETIISALISAAAAIIVCIISSRAQHKSFINELDKKDAIQEYRLSQLENKMDRHNKLIERTYELEKSRDVIETRLGNIEKEVTTLKAS